MSVVIGTTTFSNPRFFTEGRGVNLVQSGVSQAMEIHSEAGDHLASVAALRAYDYPTVSTGEFVHVASWHANGRKGGGTFKYVAGNSDADDSGFVIVDALARRWLRINTYEVDPAMFGAVGDLVTAGVAATDDGDAFNAALAYCGANGLDLFSYEAHSFGERLVSEPTMNFAMHLRGTYDWPAGCTTAGLYIEPVRNGGQPDVYCDGSRFTTGDTTHTLLHYDNKNNINTATKDFAFYSMLATEAGIGGYINIDGVYGKGSGTVTTTGWYNGIVLNCRPATIRNCIIQGQKGTPAVNGVDQPQTGLGWRGIASIFRDYDERTITNVAVDPSSGQVTVTWSGDTFNPPSRTAFVIFDNFTGDLGKALNWTMARVIRIDTVARTFVLKNFNGLDGVTLPPYTGGGTFEGSPSSATCRVQHNKITWYDTLIHLGQTEGYYVEDNRCIGGSVGLRIDEQLSLDLVGYNHFNNTHRGLLIRGVGGVRGNHGGVNFLRNPPIFMAGITITKGATTTGTWTAGTSLPHQFQNGTWITFLTTASPLNVADITTANPAVLTYAGNDTYSNGDTVILSRLPEEWKDILAAADGTLTAVIANVNTGANTFELVGVDTSAMAEEYLDLLDPIDDEGNLGYATVSGGMIQITTTYYRLDDIDRTARTFSVKTAVSGAALDSSAFNNWVSGRFNIVGEMATFDHCRAIHLSNWAFDGTGSGKIRGIRLVDCNKASGAHIHNNRISNGTYAAMELHGTTDFIYIGETNVGPLAVLNQFWDNASGVRNIYTQRRNIRDQEIDVNDIPTGFAADRVTRAYTPTSMTIKISHAGTLAMGPIQDHERNSVQGIANGTNAQEAGCGLIIIQPHSASAGKTKLADLMPRFLMPGAHADFIYDPVGLGYRELGDVSWKNVFDFYDDLFTANGVRAQTSGTAAAVTASAYQEAHSILKPLGILQMATGTDTNSSCSLGLMNVNLRVNQGASLSLIRLAIETLSDGTDTYKLRVGFHDSVAGTAGVTHGVWWEYSSADSAYWQCKTSASSVVTSVTTTQIAEAGDYIFFGQFINGDGTRADYFAFTDPAEITVFDSIDTNIPELTERPAWGVSLHKTAGTSSRNVHVDIMGMTMCNTRGRA